MKDKIKKALEELYLNGHRRNPKVFGFWKKIDIEIALKQILKILEGGTI